MRATAFIVIDKKKLCILLAAVLFLLLTLLYARCSGGHVYTFMDPGNGVIVVDPGHGGIDGGANKGGILEKEINLAIALKLKSFLEENGYTAVMTREEDVSLEGLYESQQSRHQRDLIARANIINASNAQLFVSIHVNCNFRRPATDGSIVFYGERYQESEALAYCIQRALNAMEINGAKRTIHDPQRAGYFLLKNTKIPGVIVETAFLSNSEERRLLTTDEFRERLAKAVSDGIVRYLSE